MPQQVRHGERKEMEKQYYVYIVANKKNGTLYIGAARGLVKRIWDHKTEAVDGFTKKYGLKTLVYYEILNDYEEALKREKKLKKWPRQWKLNLINEMNPKWEDLYEKICQ
jgi:putative endonuclease